MTAKYYGGSATSHSYCIIDKEDSRDKKHTIICAQRTLTQGEIG